MAERFRQVKICKSCILPETFKEISINEEGLCSYCSSHQLVAKKREVSPEYRIQCLNEIDQIINTVRGKNQYDCVVGFSGGKDSTYLLWKLKKEYQLNILAVTIDHGFFPDTVDENLKSVVKKLGIDHITYKINTGFMERFFKYKLENYQTKAAFDSMCGECSNILEGSVMKVAANFNIPLVFIGLSPEQVNRYFYEISKDHLESSWEMEYLEKSEFKKYDHRYLWNSTLENRADLKVILPFHVWEYDEQNIVDTLNELDLLSPNKSNPLRTRCKILDAMAYIDRKRLGYDGFIAPFSDLIRQGKADREKYYDLFFGKDFFINMEHINEVKTRLDLDLDRILGREIPQ